MDHIIAKLTRAEIIQRNSNLKKAARERLSKMEHKPRALLKKKARDVQQFQE